MEAKANDMELCESKVDVTNDYKINLKQKVGIANQEKIVFGQSVGGVTKTAEKSVGLGFELGPKRMCGEVVRSMGADRSGGAD